MHSFQELPVHHHVLGEQLNYVAACDDHEPLFEVTPITFRKSRSGCLDEDWHRAELVEREESRPGLALDCQGRFQLVDVGLYRRMHRKLVERNGVGHHTGLDAIKEHLAESGM